MKNTDLVQLLRELAKYLEVSDIERGTVPAKSARLAARARQAAEEIEGRREPTDEEELRQCFVSAVQRESEAIWSCPMPFDIGSLDKQKARERRMQIAGLRAVLARFGGGEAGK